MRLGYVRALALLHRAFRRHPPLQRLHILGRFLSAPFPRTLELVPGGARVLDIGSGHGLWARLVAEERASIVIAVEPDLRKMNPRFRHPNVRVVCGPAGCVRGVFDVVAIFDVLYLMNADARDALLRQAFERMRPGGTLIIKDLDPSARLKNAWDRAQEVVAVRALRLSRGAGIFEHDTREQVDARLRASGFTEVAARRIDRWYPHAHIVYTARKPQAPA